MLSLAKGIDHCSDSFGDFQVLVKRHLGMVQTEGKILDLQGIGIRP